jgi:hypothetical protein
MTPGCGKSGTARINPVSSARSASDIGDVMVWQGPQ